MLRRLDYQTRVLDVLDAYVEALKAEKRKADRIAELSAEEKDIELPAHDFAKSAWKSMKDKLPSSRRDIPFSPRSDGCGRPVPNVVLKVPTGSGQDLACDLRATPHLGELSREQYRLRAVGRAKRGHLHPNPPEPEGPPAPLSARAGTHRCRGGSAYWEKSDPLSVHDVETNLCVMLLMLQSANRETQESLKLFQDRGDVHGFFPQEGDQSAHRDALDRTPNLAAYDGMMFPMVKDSLGNALRIIRPVVVLDEGHRAISDLAFNTLYGFNPCFVLELTATPQDVPARRGKKPRQERFANLLVEVTGQEIDREGMIKMPLNLDPAAGN